MDNLIVVGIIAGFLFWVVQLAGEPMATGLSEITTVSTR